MSNQTMQRPTRRRSTKASGKTSGKVTGRNTGAAKNRSRQTARVEGLRDGKPLIFGWGAHLTRAQKHRYKQLSLLSFAGLVILAIVGTLVFGVLNETIFIPRQTIVDVNGFKISQDTYRKALAVEAQIQWNQLQSELAQHDALQLKVQIGDQQANTQDNILISQIQSAEANYQQAQITTTTINNMIDDQLILAGAKQFEQQNHVSASTFEPTQKQIDASLAAFKKAFPKNEKYSDFLSKNGLTDADVTTILTAQLRRDNMQKYLASLLVSPTRQVSMRKIESDTAANAAKIREQLVKGNLTDAIWSTLAKKDSLDPGSKDNGGNLGWVAPGTGDAAIELWAYASGRKVGDLSPVIADASGTFDVVQITGIDLSRAVDATTLKTAQDNALTHWLTEQHSLPKAKISKPVSTMLTASRNMPKLPDLNATLPAFTPPPSSGLGGGQPQVPGLPGPTG